MNTQSFAQKNFFSDIPESAAKNAAFERVLIPNVYRTVALDTTPFLRAMQTAPREFSAEAQLTPLVIALPMPNGSTQHFSIVEYSMSESGLTNLFPHIRTYSGQGIEDRTATVKLDWTDFGFHAMILSSTQGSVWIDPYARGDKQHYISYHKKDLTPKRFIEIDVLPSEDQGKVFEQSAVAGGPCLAPTLRSYRLAVACTGEYAQAVGAANAAQLHSAIVTTVNRVNGVYESEVSIRLVLIANNNIIE